MDSMLIPVSEDFFFFFVPLGRKLVNMAFKSRATVINESNLISFFQSFWGCKVTNPAECTNKLNLGFDAEDYKFR